MEILEYCMDKLSMKEFGLNPQHYVSLPAYSFKCCLMSSGVTLDRLQDRQMLDDFVEAKRGGICGVMGDRYTNNDKTMRNMIKDLSGNLLRRSSMWFHNWRSMTEGPSGT